MPETSADLIATVGAAAAFFLAAAAGVTSRRGIRLIMIGLAFTWLPFASEVMSAWIAGRR